MSRDTIDKLAAVAKAICEADRPGWDCGYPACGCDGPAEKEAMAAVRALRDLPHSILDAARGSRLASGDAAVFWNNVIDLIAPVPVDTKRRCSKCGNVQEFEGMSGCMLHDQDPECPLEKPPCADPGKR